MVIAGDTFEFTFPEGVVFPSSYGINCRGQSRLVTSVTCTKKGLRTLRAQINSIYGGTIQEYETFYFDVYDIRNPPSLRKTEAFSDILHLSRGGVVIATYENSGLTLQMEELAEMDEFTLVQSNQFPGELAEYRIEFRTEATIPSTTAIRVTLPS